MPPLSTLLGTFTLLAFCRGLQAFGQDTNKPEAAAAAAPVAAAGASRVLAAKEAGPAWEELQRPAPKPNDWPAPSKIRRAASSKGLEGSLSMASNNDL